MADRGISERSAFPGNALTPASSEVPTQDRGSYSTNQGATPSFDKGATVNSMSTFIPGVVSPPPVVVIYYKMTGMDAVLDGVYDSWRVTGSPDLTGAQYLAWCTAHGTTPLATPLRTIVVSTGPWT